MFFAAIFSFVKGEKLNRVIQMSQGLIFGKHVYDLKLGVYLFGVRLRLK